MLLGCKLSLAQEALVDSLLKQLPKQNDSLRILSFLKLSEITATKSYEKAVQYGQIALEIALDKKYDWAEAAALYQIGYVEYNKSNFAEALDYYIKALKISERLKDKLTTATYTNAKGMIYLRIGNLEEALNAFNEALFLSQKMDDKNLEATSLNNIGNVFFTKKDYEKALHYYEQALQRRQRTNDLSGIAASTNNIGITLSRLEKYQEAILFLERAVEISKKIQNYSNLSASLDNLGDIYTTLQQYDKATTHLQKAFHYAKISNNKNRILESYQSLAHYHEKTQQLDSAIFYYQKFIQLRDQIYNEEKSKQIAEMQAKYQLNKQTIENERLLNASELQNTTLQNQRIFIATILIASSLILVFLGVLVRSNRQKTKLNKILTEQRDIIEQKSAEIQGQNQKIMDSIRTAQTIQNAILPFEQEMKQTLSDYFIIYEPKDIVSGDFFWLTQVPPYTLAAVVDCTGHGVPGAFMSMIGYVLLNEIVHVQEITEPQKILNLLHKEVRYGLKQYETRNTEGMDVALCRWQTDDNGKIQFLYANAKRPLYYFAQNQLQEIQGNRLSIGGLFQETFDRSFEQHNLTLQKGDRIYLTTDGITDLPNPQRKSLGEHQLKNILTATAQLPIKQQQIEIEKMLQQFRQNTDTRDDITLWAIEL